MERKLQQFRSKDGGPDTGGTLKIYGESLCRDVPYKTLLLSVRDTAQQVVREMLEKYGLEKEADPSAFCLVQVNNKNEIFNFYYLIKISNFYFNKSILYRLPPMPYPLSHYPYTSVTNIKT